MQSSQSRSIRATELGLEKLKNAKDSKLNDNGKRLTIPDIAEQAKVSESTVKRFFKGQAIDRPLALAITEVLGLQLTDIEESADLDSAFYVQRPPIESNCYKAILQLGSLLRIKAPQQMGKTLLLNEIIDHASNQNYETVTLSFDLSDSEVFNNIKTFSKWFCVTVGDLLDLPNKLDDYWDDTFSSNSNSTKYFEKYLLKELNNNFVLALDKVDIVFEHPTIANDFCRLLRGWYDLTRRSDRRGAIWKQLRLIIVHSTEVYSSLDINSSPLANVGMVVLLPEFTSEQVHNLSKHYQLDGLGIEEVNQLMAMVGGHPNLVQTAFHYLKSQKVTLEKLLQIAPTEESPFSDHLREHLRSLEQNIELSTAFRAIVMANKPIRIESVHAFKLQSMGLVQYQGNDCSPRCDLYRQYFSVRLTDK